MRITQLIIYPVKSCAGISVLSATVTEHGLLGDREYVITDEQGTFVTQRQMPRLATLKPFWIGDRLWLGGNDGDSLCLSDLDGTLEATTVWKDQVFASDLGEAARAFLKQQLATTKSLTIRRVHPEHRREVHAKYGLKPSPRYGFADSFPFQLVSEASLEDLNQRLSEKGQDQVGMERFRPNIVLGGLQAYAEDSFKEVTLNGSVTFGLAAPCTRCIMVNVDQERGLLEHKEPLATLASYRRLSDGQGIGFGMRAYLKSGAGATIERDHIA